MTTTLRRLKIGSIHQVLRGGAIHPREFRGGTVRVLGFEASASQTWVKIRLLNNLPFAHQGEEALIRGFYLI